MLRGVGFVKNEENIKKEGKKKAGVFFRLLKICSTVLAPFSFGYRSCACPYIFSTLTTANCEESYKHIYTFRVFADSRKAFGNIKTVPSVPYRLRRIFLFEYLSISCYYIHRCRLFTTYDGNYMTMY